MSEEKGPPLSFDHPLATLATAHVYQVAARALRSREPAARMFQQGGRALYEDEDFDEATKEIIRSLGVPCQLQGKATLVHLHGLVMRRSGGQHYRRVHLSVVLSKSLMALDLFDTNACSSAIKCPQLSALVCYSTIASACTSVTKHLCQRMSA